jgi:hypothetical protein
MKQSVPLKPSGKTQVKSGCCISLHRKHRNGTDRPGRYGLDAEVLPGGCV